MKTLFFALMGWAALFSMTEVFACPFFVPGNGQSVFYNNRNDIDLSISSGILNGTLNPNPPSETAFVGYGPTIQATTATGRSVYYVDADNGSNDTGNGNQDNPWRTISYALSQVSGTDQEIHASAGTYRSDMGTWGEVFPIRIKNGVSLIGAGRDVTIIDVEQNGTVMKCENITAETRIEGFTITGGHRTDESDGMGVYISSSSNLTIENNTISSNDAGRSGNVYHIGSGIHIKSSSVTIKSNIIRNNGSTSLTGECGGGIYVGGSSSAVIRNNEIYENRVWGDGGGIFVENASSFEIEGNIIVSNYHVSSYSPKAGGIGIDSTQGTIVNNILANNSGNGIALIGNPASCQIVNNSIDSNTDDGIYLVSSASPTIVNNIISNNSKFGIREFDMTCEPAVSYNLFYNNSSGVYCDEGEYVYRNVTMMDSMVPECSDNLENDPLFVAPTKNDYHLQSSSPARDVGSNTGAPGTDIDGDTRPQNGTVDIGADEFATAATTTTTTTTTSTTLNSTTTTTLAATPIVTTGSANPITSDSATLHAIVNPNGANTTCWFQYGPTTSYVSLTATADVGLSTSDVTVNTSLSGLTAGTTYHYRIAAQNSVGTSYGSDRYFTTNRPSKAIIVAGSGPYAGNNLWAATELNTNFAFRSLILQGYTKDTIYYLSPNTYCDVDGDGKVDVDDDATSANLDYAITIWAQDAADLFIYMTGHGGDGSFRIGELELLSATDFDSWLDTIQGTLLGNVVVVIDSCRSGSFVPLLIPPSGKDRALATSAASDQEAMFASSGILSFSYLFWASIFNGNSFYQSYVHAKDVISIAYPDRQSPQIEANANGAANEKPDTLLASAIKLGNEDTSAGDLPTIGSVSEAQTLTDGASALIWAKDIIDADGISKVWAVITPPGQSNDPDNPVTDLPIMPLTFNSIRFEGTYSSFTTPGTYNIAIFAEDLQGYSSFPAQTTVTVSAGPPTATTGSATSIRSGTATLNGTVNPNGAATTYHFEYGATSAYEPPTTSVNAGSGTGNVFAAVSVSGLSTDTTYHFRIVATNGSETSYGNDNTFATLPLCPDCSGDPVELTNKTFGLETNCECTSTTSITLKDGVKIESGANVIFTIRP